MADEHRSTQIAQAVDRLVEPGEAWIVRKKKANGIEVLPENTSPLAATNPELYGRLLQINEQLSNAGGSLCIWMPIGTLILCLGLHLGWFDGLFEDTLEKIKSVWFYAIAIVVSFFLSAGLAQAQERGRYHRYRSVLLQAIEKSQISPHQLITQIEGDEALDNLADQLKEDPRIG